jgi:hypothetical protein
MQVQVVEYLGTESQVVGVIAGSSGQRLTATVPGDAHACMHGVLALQVRADDLHVFDTGTGLALRP